MKATSAVVIDGPWPSGAVDMSAVMRTPGADSAMAEGQAALSTIGRPLPPVNPQSVGCYFRKPQGDWPGDRESLASAVTANLGKLAALPGGRELRQLHMEITLHWHCLCDLEKRNVLEDLAARHGPRLGDTHSAAAADAPASPLRNWVEHMAFGMGAEKAGRLLEHCSAAARDQLATAFKAAGDDPDLKMALRSRFSDLRMTMPLDHLYDYKGFMWQNNRIYGKLPDGVAAQLKVCVVGAGPAGIIAADGLNRLGVKPMVLEQGDQIGGRLRTEKWARQDGSMSPGPIQPGGMRFHTTEGNAYWGIAEHYKLPFTGFPNPSTVHTSYIIGNEVHEARPGEEPSDPVMRKVKQDVTEAMEKALLDPIRSARDACDTAKFRELCDAAKQKFDGCTFRAGLEALLKEKGIEWGPAEWQTFGATGIGVGGYEGYFGTGFLEEFRFLVDERLEGHQALLDGADAPLHLMIADRQGLPHGAQSLEQQEAVKLGIEVTQILKKDGKYHVASLDKNDGQVSHAVYDEVFFAGGPREAVRLGLTGPQVGSEPLMPEEFAIAMEKANVVPATKMAIKIPKDLMKGVDVPGNVQASKLFQQSYLVPPIKGSDHATFYPSYTLGDNAVKVAGMSGTEQLDLYIQTLRNTASQNPEDPAHQKLGNLAAIVEQSKDRVSYTHWGLTKHQYGAFKMDEPNQLDNTNALFRALLKPTDGAIFINEENTAEGGFASGAVAAAINGVQQFVTKYGGELPPNSPFHQDHL